jgi:hypothetical protein
MIMSVVGHLMGSFRPVEPVWCCESCRRAALAAAALKRGQGGVHPVRLAARAAQPASRATTPPLTRQVLPQ